MNDINLVLAEELERIAAKYRQKSYENKDQVNIHQISLVLTEKMKRGKVKAIRSLLKKYGASKLVEVKPQFYQSFYEEAKKL